MKTPKVRVAMFGSFYRGYYVLNELLNGKLSDLVSVVGVATDDPTASFVSPEKRVWQYSHTKQEENMVMELAKENNIDVFTGKVKDDLFYKIFENNWKPELCIMATFGQLIDSRLYSYPKYNFVNLHPCYGYEWPSNPGGNPFQEMIHQGKESCVIALHQVNEKFDNGMLIAFSERIHIPKGASVTELHKLTAPIAARLITKELPKIIIRKEEFNSYKL